MNYLIVEYNKLNVSFYRKFYIEILSIIFCTNNIYF